MAFNALAAAGGARYTLGWVLSRISGFIAANLIRTHKVRRASMKK
jgi:hypothetical protein